MPRLVLAILLLLAAAPAVAQNAPPTTPRIDLYLGIGYTWQVGDGTASDYDSTGPVVKLGVNLSPRVGLVFDGSFGVSSGGQVMYSVTAGPRFAFLNQSRLVPFVQVVAGVKGGVTMTDASSPTYDTDLAAQVAAGGGLDVVVNRRWAVRVLQLEGRRMLTSGAANEWVISAGVVFRFGSVPQAK